MRKAVSFCLTLLAVLGFTAPRAASQTLVISLRDETRSGPVGGASVELLTQSGKSVRQVLSDDGGKVVIPAPEAGDYYIQATRIGYDDFRSPLLALTAEGSADLELLLRPQPIGLEGLDVTAEAQGRELLAPLGLKKVELGNRFVDRAKIEAVGMTGQTADILRWQNIAGLQVNVIDSVGHQILCVTLRQQSAKALGNCALPVLNGAVVSREFAATLVANDIESMAVLRPMEATTLYGTVAGSGAVLIWTRRGR